MIILWKNRGGSIMFKKVVVLIITFCAMSLCFMPKTLAEGYCSVDDINRVKNDVKNIKIEYEYRTDTAMKGLFDIIITGATDDVVIKEASKNWVYTSDSIVNGEIRIEAVNGSNFSFDIYYERCSNMLVDTIKVNVPKYNYYSEFDECTGIDSKEVEVCDPWYQGELTDDTFMDAINKYKESQKDKEKDDDIKDNIELILNFLKHNYIYMIGALLIIGVIVTIIIYKKKRAQLD